MHRQLSLIAALALSAACVPRPGGQCATDAECAGGTSCQAGLCKAAPVCSAGCEDGTHCAAGLCTADAPPSIQWASPEDGALRAGGRVPLELVIESKSVPRAVRVVVRARGGGVLALARSTTLRSGGGGSWRGELDGSLLPESALELLPVATIGDLEVQGPARALRIDRTGPSVELRLPAPRGDAFRRDQTLTLQARVTDAGSGVDPATVALLAPGMEPLPGQRAGAELWTFTLPLSRPSFAALSGPLGLRVVARDLVGNQGTGLGAVPLTRLLWRAELGAGLPIASSPALDSAHVYAGTGSGKLWALDRATGVALWSRELRGAITASPARGKDALYAASERGDVFALEPATGALRWSCPQLSSASRFLAAPAVARLQGLAGPGSSTEALVLLDASQSPSGAYGAVVAVEGSLGFPSASGARSCALFAELGGGAAGASIAADGAIYAGTRGAQGRLARKLRLAADASGSWAFQQEWSAPLYDDPIGAPALALDGSVAFGDAAGELSRFSSAGSSLWSPPAALGEKLLASPVIAFSTLLAQGRDGTLAPFALGPGAPATGPDAAPAYVAHQLPAAFDVSATPAVGADGTVYVAAGNSLRALAPSGAVLWEAPLPGGATASSPALGCDGALYVGDGAGTLWAIATDSLGLAAGWPRAGHDARGTGNQATAGCE